MAPTRLAAWRRPLEIFVLWSFAVAQPLFDLVGRGPTFLLAEGIEGVRLLGDVLVLAFAMPLALAAPAGLSSSFGQARAASWLHRIASSALAALFALQLLPRLGLRAPAWLLVVLALALGAALAALLGWRGSAPAVALLAAAGAIFPALFLLRSGAAPLLRAVDARALEVAVSRPAPVVLVVFDELSLAGLLDGAGRIDATRYPNFAALADTSHWFRDATTVHVWTEASIPSILTGRRPPDFVPLPTARAFPENLFTLLGRRYRLAVFESLTRLCPRELCGETGEELAPVGTRRVARDLGIVYLHLVAPEPLRARLPKIDQAWAGFGDRGAGDRGDTRRARWNDEPAELFDEFLAALTPGDRPGLYFLHVSLPHVPYRYLPSGAEYALSADEYLPHGVVDRAWGSDDWEAAQAQQRYLLQLGFVDRLVGRLRARLEARGLWDPSLVVLTADHGVSFRSGDFRRALSPTNAGAILPVPLLFKLPAERAGVVHDENAELIDVLPTIAGVLGVDLPWRVDGRPLLDPATAPRPLKIAFSGSERRSFAGALDALAGEHELFRKRFGDGAGFAPIFSLGAREGLLGNAATSFASGPATALVARLDLPRQFDSVVPGGGFVPAQIAGELDGAGADGDVELAVAVDGIVRAVTRPYGLPGRRRFAAMVPESSFRAGANRVELFRLAAAPAALALSRLELSGSAGPGLGSATPGSVASAAAPGGEATPRLRGLGAAETLEIVDERGRHRRVDREGNFGYLEEIEPRDGLLVVAGWAGSPERHRVATRVLVFLGADCLGATTPGRIRDDVAAAFGAEIAASGFRLRVPLASSTPPGGELRVIALFDDGTAGELRRLGGPPSPR